MSPVSLDANITILMYGGSRPSPVPSSCVISSGWGVGW